MRNAGTSSSCILISFFLYPLKALLKYKLNIIQQGSLGAFKKPDRLTFLCITNCIIYYSLFSHFSYMIFVLETSVIVNKLFFCASKFLCNSPDIVINHHGPYWSKWTRGLEIMLLAINDFSVGKSCFQNTTRVCEVLSLLFSLCISLAGIFTGEFRGNWRM